MGSFYYFKNDGIGLFIRYIHQGINWKPILSGDFKYRSKNAVIMGDSRSLHIRTDKSEKEKI
jgi:hypothetical protein